PGTGGQSAAWLRAIFGACDSSSLKIQPEADLRSSGRTMGQRARSIVGELSLGQVAARSGLAVSAIHFYEAERLIRSTRTAGNQRRYPREILRRVAVIKVAQRIGIPLSVIRDALATLPKGRTPTARDWNRLSSGW